MTLIEKALKDKNYPDSWKWYIILYDCPFQYGFPDDFDECKRSFSDEICTKCWSRKHKE